MFFPSQQSRGFTLIELLVVISIIGTLSTVIMASLNTARGKARDAQVRLQVKQIINALYLVRDDSTGAFPVGSSGANMWYCLKPSGSCWRGSYTGDSLITTALASSMPQIPLPPNPPYRTGTYLNGGYLYMPYGSVGAPLLTGTFLVWAQSTPINDCRGFYAGNYDGNYYCYQQID